MSSRQFDSNALLLTGVTILLVEDDPNNLLLLRDMLEIHFGATVCAVTTVHAALELFPQLKPDILLSNIALPDGDGYQLIQWVRNFSPEQGGSIPAIAITASVSEEVRIRLLKAGFQAYFFKPFDVDTLVEKIIELVRSTEFS